MKSKGYKEKFHKEKRHRTGKANRKQSKRDVMSNVSYKGKAVQWLWKTFLPFLTKLSVHPFYDPEMSPSRISPKRNRNICTCKYF